MNSLRDLLPQEQCPVCEGAGTVQTKDLTTPGRTFASVCPRCGGVGIVSRHLEDHPDSIPKGRKP